MPFKSQAQRRFMHARHPQIAKRWEQHTPKGKKLPEKVSEATLSSDMDQIRSLLEDIPPSGGTSHMTGGNTAQIAMMIEPEVTSFMPQSQGYGIDNDDDTEFDELELKIAKRFIEIIGSVERAKELISKCDECLDCLGLIDDSDVIENVAAVIPTDVDMPTASGDLSALYNPNAVA